MKVNFKKHPSTFLAIYLNHIYKYGDLFKILVKFWILNSPQENLISKPLISLFGYIANQKKG
jgi:hypothetical protein